MRRLGVWFLWQWPHALVRERNGCWRVHGPRGRRRLGWKLTMATSWVLATMWPGEAPGRWGRACRRKVLLWWWDPVFDGLRRVGLALLAWMWPTGGWRRRIPSGSVAALLLGLTAVAAPNPVRTGEGEWNAGRLDPLAMNQNVDPGSSGGGGGFAAGASAPGRTTGGGSGSSEGGAGDEASPIQQLAQLTASPDADEAGAGGEAAGDPTTAPEAGLAGDPAGDLLTSGGATGFGFGFGGTGGGGGVGGGGGGSGGSGGGAPGSAGGGAGDGPSGGDPISTTPPSTVPPTANPPELGRVDPIERPFMPDAPIVPGAPFVPSSEPGDLDDGPHGGPVGGGGDNLLGPIGGDAPVEPRNDDPGVSRPSAAPEPTTWIGMILGLGAAGAVLRRRRAAQTLQT